MLCAGQSLPWVSAYSFDVERSIVFSSVLGYRSISPAVKPGLIISCFATLASAGFSVWTAGHDSQAAWKGKAGGETIRLQMFHLSQISRSEHEALLAAAAPVTLLKAGGSPSTGAILPAQRDDLCGVPLLGRADNAGT